MMAETKTSSWYSIPAYQVENPAIWAPIEAILDRACEEYRASDVCKAVLNGEQQLWVAAPNGPIVSVLLTQIHRAKAGQILTVLFCGGEQMNLWIDERWRLMDFARQQNCIAVRFEGRPGWRRSWPEAKKIGDKMEIRL